MTSLQLDHASIAVPDFGAAVEHLERLGLDVNVSPAARNRHGRVHLDRAYLEIAASDHPAWDVEAVMLRYSSLAELRLHLDRAGFSYREAVYEGVDGRWDDVELECDTVPLPILVRRTEPADVARDWPPALQRAHRCGALTLAAVHIPVGSIAGAAAAYARLLGRNGRDARVGTGLAQSRAAVFDLDPATLVLVERYAAPAIVLGVSALDATRAVLPSGLLPLDERGIAWLHPSTTANLMIGFVEEAQRLSGSRAWMLHRSVLL